MGAYSNLQRRVTGYYYRQAVPLHLQKVIGKKEITRSLQTAHLQEAKQRCNEYAALMLKWFTELEAEHSTTSNVIAFKPISCSYGNMPSSQLTTPPNTSSNTITIDALFIEWVTYKGLASSHTTYKETERPVKTFIELHGDVSVTAITSEHIKGLRQHYISSASLKPQTIKKYLGCIRKLLNHAETHDIVSVPEIASGCFTVGLSDQCTDRSPWSTEQLHTLFRSPYFTGYKSPHRKHVAGDMLTKDALYWLPLVALYTGMRIEEIAQLAIDDIKCNDDNIWIINITDAKSFQQLKNQSSKRVMPIHRELYNLGFIIYYQSIKAAGHERLFPDLNATEANRLSKKTSAQFSKYKTRLGFDETLTFHSFRHTFKDACRDAAIERDVHDALTGHSDSSVSASYGSGFSLKRLHKAIESISYDIDLSHLYDADIKPILTSPYAVENTPATQTPVAQAREQWVLLKDAYLAAGKAMYGDSFLEDDITRLIHDHKQRIDNGLKDNQNMYYLSNHPAYSDASGYADIASAGDDVIAQAQHIRMYLLKAINNDTKVKLIDAEGVGHVEKAIPYLRRDDRFKVYYMESLIDDCSDGDRLEYQVYIERSSFDSWLTPYNEEV